MPPNPPLTWAQFSAQRKWFTTQYFPFPGATRTVLVSSHIWWTEQIALSFYNLGYNILFYAPFYLLYLDPNAAAQFDIHWNQTLADIEQFKVDLILGGNSTAMLVHPRTGIMLQDAATQRANRRVTLVNWWWDEPRTKPPMATKAPVQSGAPPETILSPEDYLRLLANENTLNAIWDIDVKEELETQYGLKNLFHLPLATLPEFWPHGYIPLEDRPIAACFLGNCHFTADYVERDDDPQVNWAREIALAKIAAPEIPMITHFQCITKKFGGMPPAKAAGDAWTNFARPWELVNAAYMHYTRNKLVQAAAKHLKGKLALIGKGWEKLGLRANMEHAGEKSGIIYAQSKISLNLFGGCVHGGLPLRPYDIAASGGLILTHDQRELPALFENEKECLAFRNSEQMLKNIQQVLAHPADFNILAHAGRHKSLQTHTWKSRLERLASVVHRS